MFGKRKDYEHIPEFEIEQAEWSKDEPLARFYGRKHLRIILGFALVVCGIIGLVHWGSFSLLKEVTSLKPEPPRQQTHPTLLSVVDPESGNYLLAISNPLYRKVQQANFTFAGKLKTLSLDKQRIDAVGDSSITISWVALSSSDNDPVKETDVIALFCGDHGFSKDVLEPQFFLEAATIAQVRATNQKHGGRPSEDEWYIPQFPILRQESCMFTLFQESDENSYIHTASSTEISFYSIFTPTGIHLTYGDDISSIVVMFNTGEGRAADAPLKGVPTVMYGPRDGQLDTIATGISETYRAEDMCHAPANETSAGRFYAPGLIHTVVMKDLKPDTEYAYKVGYRIGQSIVWSEEYTFVSSPVIGDTESFSLIVYGDQGCPESGWVDGEEWVKGLASRESQHSSPIRAVLHYGDLAYGKFNFEIFCCVVFYCFKSVRLIIALLCTCQLTEPHTSGKHGCR